MNIDFYLESHLGLWFARYGQFTKKDVFFTRDSKVATALTKRGAFASNIGSPQSRRAFSISWQSKISDSLILSYDYFLNIHPGFIPLSRGSFPIFWSIFLNQKAGVTVHQITDKMDFGPVFKRKEVCFTSKDNAGDLWTKIVELEKIMLLEAIDDLRQSKELDFINISGEKVGENKTKKEFYSYLNNPPLESMSQNEITRLKLAVTHPNYPLPNWI